MYMCMCFGHFSSIDFLVYLSTRELYQISYHIRIYKLCGGCLFHATLAHFEPNYSSYYSNYSLIHIV